MKKLIFKLIRWSGLVFIFRILLQKDKVTILLFHDEDPVSSKRNFLYLKKHYNIISLKAFLDAKKSPETIRLPPKSLIITIDDGHVGNFGLLPVIKDLNIPVTIFLCAGIINTNRHFWFTKDHQHFTFKDFTLMSNRAKLEKLKEIGFTVDKQYDHPQALNEKQISEMRPFIDFQAHTFYHPILPKCDRTEAIEEIIESKHMLEDNFKLKINSFAYPNGDYSERDIELCKKAGYSCAITVDYGFNSLTTDPFRLKRLPVGDVKSIDELAIKASGVSEFLSVLFGVKPKTKFANSYEE